MKEQKGAISCPVCQCSFIGRYCYQSGPSALKGKLRKCPNGHIFPNPVKPKKDKSKELREFIRCLYSEVNCRIEHGAESGGHLEYVQEKLREILNKWKD